MVCAKETGVPPERGGQCQEQACGKRAHANGAFAGQPHLWQNGLKRESRRSNHACMNISTPLNSSTPAIP